MKKRLLYRTAEEKERILLDIKRIGVVAGCRKHNVNSSSYYEWLDKYESQGLKGLRDRRKENLERDVKTRDKEIRLLKEIIVEKELQIKMQQELLEKKYLAWKQKGQS